MLHFRPRLGDLARQIMVNTNDADARLRPHTPYAICENPKATAEEIPESWAVNGHGGMFATARLLLAIGRAPCMGNTIRP
jgi:hypothetical protein